MINRMLPALLVLLPVFPACGIDLQTVPYKVPARMPDVLTAPPIQQVQLAGYLGRRVAANEAGRLLVVNEDELLGGYQHRPGSHPWIGEHVGKFLHAATLAWANTQDPQLKAKIDRVASELMKCQMPDGYLGTYLEKDRWTSWDVWSHKYCMIGLLTYYQYTGDPKALEVCRKMADLLIATFPAKKSIIKAGEHVGMAATSVLEPIVRLYRFTGDPRYLDFAGYILRAWDEPGGPRVLSSLLTTKSVHRTANGKAYEMLSNLVGLCELARATGNREYLTAVTNAWDDIVAHQLYITGTASHGEHFGNDDDLPNQASANVGETCVSVTWIQLNIQLLRLTGQARYADELERTFYNHLAAAQRPDGSMWCYYTSLAGTKPYTRTVCCCLSSGPRGMALAPTAACLQSSDGVVIESLDSFRATCTAGGREATIDQESGFPHQGSATIALSMAQPATFSIRLRAPGWAAPIGVKINGAAQSLAPQDGYITLPARRWTDGDRIALSFSLAPRAIVGDHGNEGAEALAWGPFVLAYDMHFNPGLPRPAALALIEGLNGASLTVKPAPVQPFAFEAAIRTAPGAAPSRAVFVPFADAGASGGRYQVWMPTANKVLALSLLSPGRESRSRGGNVAGSINDGDMETFVVTFDGTRKDTDFYAVSLDAPATVQRIVYAHGRSFHDGGWFDTSAGKPQIQIRRRADAAWETIATLDAYPATTSTRNPRLKDGQPFTLRLAEPIRIVALRITGTPACGDNPAQAFSSCAELEAFAK